MTSGSPKQDAEGLSATRAEPVTPIGRARTIWPEKFGIPRQPGLVDADAWIEFHPPFDREEAFVGLESFSHVWIVFRFDAHSSSVPARLSVRPPRLGGNRRLGVFATRSSWRPNALGLSVVALRAIEVHARRVRLVVGGLDVVDGTAVLDIKPYVPWVDAVEDARGGFATLRPRPVLRVDWAPEVLRAGNRDGGCARDALAADVRAQIEATIALDPRPAYRTRDRGASGSTPPLRHHVRVAGWEADFRVVGDVATIDALRPDMGARAAGLPAVEGSSPPGSGA